MSDERGGENVGRHTLTCVAKEQRREEIRKVVGCEGGPLAGYKEEVMLILPLLGGGNEKVAVLIQVRLQQRSPPAEIGFLQLGYVNSS
jgi:hypothetical protein